MGYPQPGQDRGYPIMGYHHIQGWVLPSHIRMEESVYPMMGVPHQGWGTPWDRTVDGVLDTF